MDLVDLDRPRSISKISTIFNDGRNLHYWPVLHSWVMLDMRLAENGKGRECGLQ